MGRKTTAAPGPWTYDETEEKLYDGQGNMIGRIEPASGFLASAAPELLMIADEIIAPFRTHGELMALARSARAKAGLE